MAKTKWRYTKRKINGKTKRVKVHRTTGRVRVVGHINTTDKGTPFFKPKGRKKGYVNNPDSKVTGNRRTSRKNYSRKKMLGF